MIYIISILILVTTIYFCLIAFTVIGFLKIRKQNSPEPKDEPLKKISVIIPVRDEEISIIQCLDSLKKQEYDVKIFEVIIVDDHSTDNTKNIINNFINESELNIRVLSLTDKKSKKEALKCGVENSNHDIIATTDADCILPKKWLKNISLQFDSEVSMLLGPVIFNNGHGFLSAFQMLDMMAIQGVEFGTLNFNKPILNNAANLAYSKKAYNDVDGFDVYETPSGDDVFLLEKFKSTAKNIRGLLAQDFIVETESEVTLFGFLNQRLRWSSKAKYYSDRLLIFFSSMVLIQNVSLVFIFLGIALVEKYALTFTILLLCKWLIDFILLFLVSSFFKRRKVLFYFILVQIVYPIYIVVVVFASMIMRFEWKERKF